MKIVENKELNNVAITKQSIDVGGAGVAFGRNVFQSSDPTKLLKALALIVHKSYEIEEAIKETNLKLDA